MLVVGRQGLLLQYQLSPTLPIWPLSVGQSGERAHHMLGLFTLSQFFSPKFYLLLRLLYHTEIRVLEGKQGNLENFAIMDIQV